MRVFRRVTMIMGAFVCCMLVSLSVNAETLWIQPACAAFDNIYGTYFDDYHKENFENGKYLNEVLAGNIRQEGAEVYLDFGYFTEYVDIFKNLGRISQDYQLPKTFYTITEIGGTYPSGIYNAPYIETDCPEGMSRYQFWVDYYTKGVTNQTNLFENYVPKYIREQRGEFDNAVGFSDPCNHEYVIESEQEASCGKKGIKKYICSLCGNAYEEYIEITNKHSYEVEIIREEVGVIQFRCRVCDLVREEDILKKVKSKVIEIIQFFN